MNRHIFACSTAGVFALAIGIAAQTPATGAPTQPQTQPAAAGGGSGATIEGCLMLERDVRKSNVVERATGTEDYILTAAKVLKGTAPASASTGAVPAPIGTAGGSATAAASGIMFDVRGIDQARLKSFEGKRVEIDGTFADAERSATAGTTQDLVDIRATAVRASTNTAACPAAK